jgi:hypothetical protein
MSDELLVTSQKFINHSTSPKSERPIVRGLIVYTSQLTIQESKI